MSDINPWWFETHEAYYEGIFWGDITHGLRWNIKGKNSHIPHPHLYSSAGCLVQQSFVMKTHKSTQARLKMFVGFKLH